MKITDKGAQFHHTRKPTVKPKPSAVQFLCASCHRKYGHENYTVTKQDPYGFGTVKEPKIKRKKVRKHPSLPYWKEKPKTAKKKTGKTKKQKTTRKRKAKRRTR